jgi:alpha-tubulin suppressor-like RCC1 family protein
MQVSGLAEVLAGARIVMVAAGCEHLAASTSEGEVLTWGAGYHGQLGHGDRENRPRPVKLGRELFGGSAVAMVSCGYQHTMVVTALGRLFTFGAGNFGQLGHGDRNDQDVPVEVGAALFRGARIALQQLAARTREW